MEENKNINEEEIKQETAEGQAEEPTNPENQETPENTEEQETLEKDVENRRTQLEVQMLQRWAGVSQCEAELTDALKAYLSEQHSGTER